MKQDDLQEMAKRCRLIAGTADQFTKRRLLDLATRYEARLASPPPRARKPVAPPMAKIWIDPARPKASDSTRRQDLEKRCALIANGQTAQLTPHLNRAMDNGLTQTEASEAITQSEGGSIEEIHPGDIVWFPAGEKHWHGATATTAMTHIAITESLGGKNVDWLEKVSDGQYRK